MAMTSLETRRTSSCAVYHGMAIFEDNFAVAVQGFQNVVNTRTIPSTIVEGPNNSVFRHRATHFKDTFNCQGLF